MEDFSKLTLRAVEVVHVNNYYDGPLDFACLVMFEESDSAIFALGSMLQELEETPWRTYQLFGCIPDEAEEDPSSEYYPNKMIPLGVVPYSDLVFLPGCRW